MKQKLFRETYVKDLRKAVELGTTVEYYKDSTFVYDEDKVLIVQNLIEPKGLLEKLDAENDFQSAVCIYEAFNSLDLIQASDERLWTYLTHVDLYPYMIKRWPKVYEGKAENSKQYILKHWFLNSSAQSSLLRHALAGLWWAVYLSVDDSRGNDKYDLTKILFRQLDFPTRTLGTYKLGRHKEAVLGILEFIEENEELFKNKFESKARFVTKHLNIIGGVKPISYYDKFYFKTELQKIKDKISSC